jgi:hypothetical protein
MQTKFIKMIQTQVQTLTPIQMIAALFLNLKLLISLLNNQKSLF